MPRENSPLDGSDDGQGTIRSRLIEFSVSGLPARDRRLALTEERLADLRRTAAPFLRLRQRAIDTKRRYEARARERDAILRLLPKDAVAAGGLAVTHWLLKNRPDVLDRPDHLAPDPNEPEQAADDARKAELALMRLIAAAPTHVAEAFHEAQAEVDRAESCVCETERRLKHLPGRRRGLEKIVAHLLHGTGEDVEACRLAARAKRLQAAQAELRSLPTVDVVAAELEAARGGSAARIEAARKALADAFNRVLKGA